MTPKKKIVYRNANGHACVAVPQLYELVLLQRGHPDYDPSDDIKQLASGGVPASWLQNIFDLPPVDIELEKAKVEKNGRNPASIPAYLTYQVARQKGGLTFEAALQAIIDKDIAWQSNEYAIFNPEDVPNDESNPLRVFRRALDFDANGCKFDIPKCKAIAHERRREKRAAEFAPLDVEATIPAKAAQAEAKRQAIREKYDAMQQAIDAAQTVEQIKAALSVNA